MTNGILWLGALCAAVISWSINGSYVWAMAHALLGWVYVVYALVFVR